MRPSAETPSAELTCAEQGIRAGTPCQLGDLNCLVRGPLVGHHLSDASTCASLSRSIQDPGRRCHPTVGIVIEDVPGASFIDHENQRVNLYSLVSATAAAYQAQAKELEGLKARLAAVEATCARANQARCRPRRHPAIESDGAFDVWLRSATLTLVSLRHS